MQATINSHLQYLTLEYPPHGESHVSKHQETPFVLLHGWGQSLRELVPLGEILATGRTAILIDLPGFGESPLPPDASNAGGGWGTDQYATAVKSLLDSLSVTKCILVGHSFGGRISVRLAHRYPELVSGLILIASHGIPRQRSLHEKFRAAVVGTAVKVAKWIDACFGTSLFEKKIAPRFGSADYKAAGNLRKTFVKTVTEDLSPLAATIVAPTLLLWGEKDRETPPDIGERYHRLIKNSKFILLAGKGHEPFKDVGSHLLASHIEQFLDQQLDHQIARTS